MSFPISVVVQSGPVISSHFPGCARGTGVFVLVSMLLYEHIWFLNMLGLVDNDYRFVIKCNLRIYL